MFSVNAAVPVRGPSIESTIVRVGVQLAYFSLLFLAQLPQRDKAERDVGINLTKLAQSDDFQACL